MLILSYNLVLACQELTRWVDGLEPCYAWDRRGLSHHSRFHDGKYATGGFTMANVCFDLCGAKMLLSSLQAFEKNDLLLQQARASLDFSYHS